MNSPYKRCSLFSFILASGLFTGAFAADRKIVFALSSDQHYGIPSYTNNPAVVQGIWNLPLVWTNWGPAWTNQTLDNLRGIVCLGDVVNHPHPSYWNLYSQVYTDMRDGGQMPCTVYDGYENHDLGSSIWTNMAARNAQLKNVRLSPNNACYSWDWQDVHFIQLNLYPGTNADCRGSYAFLTNDLATCVGKTGRPVVLFHHYGFSPNLLTVDWPTNSVPLYADAISNYNIAAIFSGHTHHNQRYQFGTITNYVTGSAGEFGKFSVVMIDNTNIVFRSLNATMTNPILYTWTNTITPPIEPVFMASTDKKTGQSVSVTGTLNTAATTINWSNSLNGTSGKIPASVNWTITNIPLQIGENQLVFSAMSSDREPLISELSVPTRSINWFAVSDTHFNPPVGREYLFPYNKAVIRAINNLAGKAYPNASWGTVPTPRGVTHTGDCTDGGSAGSWAAFNDAYGVNGFGMVPYPVYEGYGNHDTYRADPATDAPVNISLRNAMRRNI
ncbi:MAG: hypothetical protein FJ220_05170, partial [Kiritimatiellaceae bacterium]|nr:hypothetical protein [Kiritimatiellaceae bacterium]